MDTNEYVYISKLKEFEDVMEQIGKVKERIVLRSRDDILKYITNSDIQESIDLFYNKAYSLNPEITKIVNDIEEELIGLKKQDIVPIKILNKNEDEELKLELYNYLYWKYIPIIEESYLRKNELKQGNIKYLLKIKSGTEYSEERIVKPIAVNITCPICGEKGEIKLLNLKNFSSSYKCNNCGHNEKTDLNEYEKAPIINCECKECKRIKTEAFKNFRTNMLKLSEKFICIAGKKYDEAMKNKIEINDDKFKRDYIMYSKNLTKDEQEILMLNPKTIIDINKITYKKAEERYLYGDLDYRDIVERNMISNKIIYKIYNLNEDKNAAIKSLVFNKIGGVTRTSTIETCLEWIKDKSLLNKIKSDFINILINGNEEEFYSILIANQKYLFAIRDVNDKNFLYVFSDIGKSPLIISSENFCEDKHYVLNKYYLKSNVDLKAKIKNTKKLLDDIKKNIFMQLKDVYSEYIIIPDLELNKILKIEKLNDLIDSNELKYLQNSKCDFAIFNLEFYPVMIVELKQNERSLWEKEIRKYAVNTLGIQYEEI